MLSFFPRGVLDEILNLIESVSEGFLSYSSLIGPLKKKYGIYKPKEVEHPIKKRVSFSDVQPPEVYESHISNRPIK